MKIYIDENIPRQIAQALNIIQEALNRKNGTDVQVRSIVDDFKIGAKDEEWLPEVAGCVVITQDNRIQTTRHQRDLCVAHGVGMVFISAGKKGMTFWEFTQLLIKHWDEILKITHKPKFPFAYRITRNGKVEKLD